MSTDTATREEHLTALDHYTGRKAALDALLVATPLSVLIDASRLTRDAHTDGYIAGFRDTAIEAAREHINEITGAIAVAETVGKVG